MRAAVAFAGLLALAVPASWPAAAQPGWTGAAVAGASLPVSDSVKPVGATGRFVNKMNATFGRERPEATVHSMAELRRIAYFRYIYGDATTTGAGTDGLYDNYRSRHRDYPDGDRRSLHVFTGDRLVLKAHCGLETERRQDCGDGNIESGIMRFSLPVKPGDFVEIRTRMPAGRFAWPAFWLNPGTQAPPATPGGKPVISVLDWPPEIDIFDQFGFDGVAPGHYLISGTPTGGNDAKFGSPHDLFRDPAWGDKWYYTTSADLTAGDHVFGFDWGRDNRIRYLLDGKVYKETYYEWRSKGDVPAHLIASLQVGAKFNNLSGITDQDGKPNGWDWRIDYVRVWTRTPD
ncbi:MAG: glycoside hydrolase family 16 protein [Janthinobacterium lividum]